MTLFLLFTCSSDYFNACVYAKIKITYSENISSFYNRLGKCLKVAHSANNLINLYNTVFKMPFRSTFTYILSPRKFEFYLSMYMSFLYLS